jgi:hypothetical protein
VRSGIALSNTRHDFKSRLQEGAAGAKAHVFFSAFSARLKPCPDTKRLHLTSGASFPTACKECIDREDCAMSRKKPGLAPGF